MISQKDIYPDAQAAQEEGLEKSVGGLKLDDKTLLEECFINFHDLIKKARFKMTAMLQNHEKNNR